MNAKNISFDFYGPKLDPSHPIPVPVLFKPFKNNEKKCNYCGIEYSKTLKFEQKYCKNCLLRYVKYMDNDVCLNKYVSTSNTHQCIKHKATRDYFCTTSIQEWYEYCSEILYFTHLIPNTSSIKNYSLLSHIKSYSASRTIYSTKRSENITFKLIEYGQEHLYIIYSEWVNSIFTKGFIQILNLSWWDNFDKFCLTTNIIFGITSQSQCKNCKRISFINVDIINIDSKNCIVDDFILTITKNNTDSDSLKFIRIIYINMVKCIIEWIPYSQFKDIRKIREGGFRIIYKATWSDSIRKTDIALKKLFNSQKIGIAFSKKSDIYSFGMIMWELITGCKPFANVKHNVSLIYEIIDGK
ncbi:hypothetical protein C1646_764440 [Rhizophagus diaphanus]|nr:hypothetical protein C1646_764440 [Rhizophagus diaphanus] [Rhizophagus sp. MUCL 43196]